MNVENNIFNCLDFDAKKMKPSEIKLFLNKNMLTNLMWLNALAIGFLTFKVNQDSDLQEIKDFLVFNKHLEKYEAMLK